MEITDVNTLFGAYPSQHPDRTAETLVATMEAQHVDYGLALSTWGLFYNDVAGNAETMRACRQHDRLIPVATFNPTGYWGQDGLIEGILQEPFEMFRFFPHEQGWPYDFAPFAQILAKLAAGPRMPLMISVHRHGDITQAARILADYPWPVILEGAHGSMASESIAALRVHERLYLETSQFHIPDSLLLLRDTVGIGRVLFGSDAPGMSLSAALRLVQRSALSEEDQAAVLGGNAQRLWHDRKEE